MQFDSLCGHSFQGEKFASPASPGRRRGRLGRDEVRRRLDAAGSIELLEQRLLLSASYPNPTFPAGYAYNQNIAGAPTLAYSNAIDSYIANYYNSSGTSAPYDYQVNIGSTTAPINMVHGNGNSSQVVWTNVNISNNAAGNSAVTETVKVPMPLNPDGSIDLTMEGETFDPHPQSSWPTGVPEGHTQGTAESITSISESGTTVTATLSAIDGNMKVNTPIQIAGFTGTAAGYNGIYGIVSISGNVITYKDTTPSLPSSSGGTAQSIYNGSDSKLLIYDQDNNVLYELYQTSRPTENWGYAYSQQNTAGQWYMHTFTKFNLGANDYEVGGMTAAGLSYSMLQPTPAELQSVMFTGNTTSGSTTISNVSSVTGLSIGQVVTGVGVPSATAKITAIGSNTITLSVAATATATAVSLGAGTGINHALYFEMPSPYWVAALATFPGLKTAGGAGFNAPNAPYDAARVRLKASVDISSLSPDQQAIANALKTYGAYMTDQSYASNEWVTAAAYSLDANNQNPLSWASLSAFNLPMQDFEWVDQTPQITGVSESSGHAGDTITITGKNFSYAPSIATIGTINMNAVNVQQATVNTGATWTGTQIQVGSKDLTVTDLGRYVNTGDTGTRQVEIVNTSGTVIAGPVTVNMSVDTPGNWAYAALATPVTLTHGQTYYLVSLETSGTVHEWSYKPPSWEGSDLGPVYYNGTSWVTSAATNYGYPVDMKFQIKENVTGPSVLFGGSASSPNLATNVHVVNDTTITATVPTAPTGYNNVDVQVLAGTDYSETGWHLNIQDPGPQSGAVFGYGFDRQYVPFSYGGTGSTEGVGPMAPPLVPNLRATAGNNSVVLNWTTPYGITGNPSTDPVTYNVYRGTAGGFESSTPIATGLAASTTSYTDNTAVNGTTYYYQIVTVDSVNATTTNQFYGSFRSNEAMAQPQATSSTVNDANFTVDSIAQAGGNMEVPGFSSNDWEQLAWSGNINPLTGQAYGFTVYPDPNWGGPGSISVGYPTHGVNPAGDHINTIAGVWDPTTDTYAPLDGNGKHNPFPNGGFSSTAGTHVAWIDAPTFPSAAAVSKFSTGNIVQQTSLTSLTANNTYTLTVGIGARTDTAFAGYEIQLWYGSVDPVTGMLTGTQEAYKTVATAPVAGGFGDDSVSFTPSSNLSGQHLIVVLSTDYNNNAYNASIGDYLHGNNAQHQPQTDFTNVRLTVGSTISVDDTFNDNVSNLPQFDGGTTNWTLSNSTIVAGSPGYMYGTSGSTNDFIWDSSASVYQNDCYVLTGNVDTLQLTFKNAGTTTSTAYGSASLNASWYDSTNFTGGVTSANRHTNILVSGLTRPAIAAGATGVLDIPLSALADGGQSFGQTGDAIGYMLIYNLFRNTGLANDSDMRLIGVDFVTTSPQIVTGQHVANGAVAPTLTQAEIAPVAAEAIKLWSQTGISAAQIQTLENVKFEIKDLPAGIAGQTSGLGAAANETIVLDDDASGYGWSTGKRVNPDEVDLLTVIEHEYGHVLGNPDVEKDLLYGGVMDTTLHTGVRRVLPSASHHAPAFYAGDRYLHDHARGR